ncbi:SapC family protein [Magnetococcus marinus MC-1]|uniref:SapC family protein n=1 Tax=Magnetococcus marinus (strain ATCC BAA-1437 / JCM 17883 / MC-1) TaxID=156889 RepID=A0L9R0_MAGMM|nr:SapC family protein [Magnetococcus marinus]ABK44703.1 SapC family protein [Magnetococcus marinus MC-1]
MFESMVPVNRERHGHKKVRADNNFSFASHFHLAYLTMHEFARAASIYPVVFLEESQNDTFRPVALLGLEAGENLFVSAQGEWLASYIPAIIRRYPFALTKAGDDRYVVCLDEASSMINDDEGLPLFDEQGEPTQVIENVRKYLGELQQMDQMTQAFTQFLQANNLLTPLNMRVNGSSGVRNISGCYVINEERMNKFSNEKFLEVREKGFLPAIYAQLISLSQIERLASMQKEGAALNVEREPLGQVVAAAKSAKSTKNSSKNLQ